MQSVCLFYRRNRYEKNYVKNSLKSYLIIFLWGIFAGVATRLTDFFRADTLWSFSSVATLFGFWILSVAVIVLFSTSNVCAGVSTFLYMFGMTLSFYGLQYLLGFWLPRFDNDGFKTSLFLLYTCLSVGCGVGAFVLFFWERWRKLGAVLYALPVGALMAEAVGVGVYLVKNSTYLFQFLLDALAAVVLGILFYQRNACKAIYTVSVVAVTAAVYFFIYYPVL